MPKLKSALASHQAHQARLNAQANAGKVKEDKERSLRHGKSKKKVKVGPMGKPDSKDMDGGVDHRAAGKDQGSSARKTGTSHGPDPPHASGTALREGERQGESSTSVPASLPGANGKGKAKASNPQPTNPIDRDDTVLLLGEANFSFAMALISPPHSHPPRLVCATSYDSEQTCYIKYPDARSNVSLLREAGVKVDFGVDAGALEKSKGAVGKGRRWSRVVFNFPHVGAGIKDQERNILSNQHLLLRTFRSVGPLLTDGPSRMKDDKSGERKKRKRKSGDDDDSDDNDENDMDDFDDKDDFDDSDPEDNTMFDAQDSDKPFSPPKKQGTILITLLNQPPYTLWSLPRLGTRPPPLCPGTNLPQPKYELLRSFIFDPAIWAGYEHRRTLGFKDGVSKGWNEEILGRRGEARTWEFALKPNKEDGEERGSR